MSILLSGFGEEHPREFTVLLAPALTLNPPHVKVFSQTALIVK
jgi:hypothetical protein